MEMCVGVCVVGAHVRVLARACGRVRVCCAGAVGVCRASLLTPGTVRPFPSCPELQLYRTLRLGAAAGARPTAMACTSLPFF